MLRVDAVEPDHGATHEDFGMNGETLALLSMIPRENENASTRNRWAASMSSYTLNATTDWVL